MKKCRFCAEDIQDAAIVCKHCGRDLAGRTAGSIPHAERTGLPPMVRIAAIVLFVGAMGLVILTVVSGYLHAVGR